MIASTATQRQGGARQVQPARRSGRGTRAAASAPARAAAPSPARRAGRPSPTRSARAARRRARGPIAAPAEKLAIHTPIAIVRCRGSRNMLRRSATASTAPASRRRPRAAPELAISISALVENAASTEVTPNAAAPISSSRRRPIRSPSVPIVIRRAGDQEPVDVDDPQQLGAAGLEVRAQATARRGAARSGPWRTAGTARASTASPIHSRVPAFGCSTFSVSFCTTIRPTSVRSGLSM